MRNIIIGFFIALPAFAYAQAPSIAFFNSGSSTINSNQIASLTWRITDGGGWTFSMSCVQGVSYKKTDGTNLPCTTSTSSVLDANGGIDIAIKNLTGVQKVVRAKLTPKDASGIDVVGSAQEITIAVNPISIPIEPIFGPTITNSKSPYKLAWTGNQIDRVNVTVSCNPNVRTTSSSFTLGGTVPCNTPIFENDLPGSGSVEFMFDNIGTATSTITLTVLPAMEPGLYTGQGAQSIVVDVAIATIPDPITNSFTAKGTDGRVSPETPITLSWSTTNSEGVTILFSCNERATPMIMLGNATSTPACGTSTQGELLPTSGTLDVVFKNSSFTTEIVTLTLAPKSKKGGFDATRGKTITLSILAKNTAATPPTTIAAVATTAPVLTPTQSTASTPVKFTRYLYRGITHKEVASLQEYLKTRPELYPEGLVSAYFGPATERAVKRLQEKYGLGTTTTPGYGGVGPKTRALLNSLVK